MNVSVFILVLLPVFLDVVYSDESTHNVSSLLDLYAEFGEIKEKVNKLTKGKSLAYNLFKNYRVKAEHNEDEVRLSGRECWNKCTMTNGCTSASVDTKGGTCKLSRVTYVSYDVLEKAVGWEVFTRHTPIGLLDMLSPAISSTTAKQYCESMGLSIASIEDLTAAHTFGYENCDCGWTEFGAPYFIMQKATEGCLNSIGVIKCPEMNSISVYCKPKKIYPIKIESMKGVQQSDYPKICKSKGTSVASMDDLLHAYHLGYESCNCGWTSDGYPYIVRQNPVNRCGKAVGIVPCNYFKTINVWCKEG